MGPFGKFGEKCSEMVRLLCFECVCSQNGEERIRDVWVSVLRLEICTARVPNKDWNSRGSVSQKLKQPEGAIKYVRREGYGVRGWLFVVPCRKYCADRRLL